MVEGGCHLGYLVCNERRLIIWSVGSFVPYPPYLNQRFEPPGSMLVHYVCINTVDLTFIVRD